uniref:C2H2-type domain-containing protein n=1 Tax=Panagrolaimus superbus TaxID=310955 RepID=A0A914Z884_9BILA
MKLLRNREKQLQCALCNESVKNVESNVRTHIASHADTSMSCLICKLCCFSSGDLHQMFQHMGSAHPSNRTCYEDRRNMTQLSELLSTCFPRGGVTKQRSGFIDSIQKVINVAKKRNETYINCAVCQKDIQATKEVLTRHMSSHHVYR